MSPEETPRKPRRRLFWRIYIYAMIFVVVLIGAMMGIMFLVVDRPPPPGGDCRPPLASQNAPVRRPPPPRPPRDRGAIPLSLTLVVFAVFSLVLARSIAKPLEKLTTTARRIARGDLSARSGLERKDELGVLARSIDEMAARLEDRFRGEKELLANISHEIRTPLSRIRVALELCGEAEATLESVRARLSGIDQDVAELEQLLENVFIATRIELAAGLPSVEVDPSLFKLVLNNLLDNAAKYSEPGTTVELAARADSNRLILEVRDRGMGVSARDLPHLFEPFFRSEKSKARVAGGTGLGLNLCQRIAEAHGGAIAAEPRPGGGLILRIDLPLEE
jgi:two-component system OmpR family sensor kinase